MPRCKTCNQPILANSIKLIEKLELDICELQSLRSDDAVTIKMLSDQLRDYDNRLIPELRQRVEKMKCCENCNFFNYKPHFRCLGCNAFENWEARK